MYYDLDLFSLDRQNRTQERPDVLGENNYFSKSYSKKNNNVMFSTKTLM